MPIRLDNRVSQADRYLEFSQVKQSDRWHSCEAAFYRLENMTDDFDAIMRGSTKFTDVNFPIDDGIYWADAG